MKRKEGDSYISKIYAISFLDISISMMLTTISSSYLFLIFTAAFLIFSLYFKVLFIKTSPDSKSRNKILGNMKDPITWRKKNNQMAYISLFWAFISVAIFAYLRFFYKRGLISSIYVFAYIAVIIASVVVLATRKEKSY